MPSDFCAQALLPVSRALPQCAKAKSPENNGHIFDCCFGNLSNFGRALK
jgi:hypothetical protein